MRSAGVRTARDYNRSLPGAVAWAHAAAAAVAPVIARAWRWTGEEWRGGLVRPAILTALAFAVMWPYDARLYAFARSIPLGDDGLVELRAWQQFGGLGSIAFVLLAVWLMDRGRARRGLDLVVATAVMSLIGLASKMMVGRPRPEFGDHLAFPGPLGEYPLGAGRGVMHGWEFWRGSMPELWSMPSTHVAHAVILAAFLTAMYPRFRPLAWLLVGVVAVGRVMLGKHWPTDVVVGAGIGHAVAALVIGGRWGERAAVRWWSEGGNVVRDGDPAGGQGMSPVPGERSSARRAPMAETGAGVGAGCERRS